MAGIWVRTADRISDQKGEAVMILLYEKIYRQKQEQYKLDGDLQAFNKFISEAHDFQFAVMTKKISENEYAEWLNTQCAS